VTLAVVGAGATGVLFALTIPRGSYARRAASSPEITPVF
jgi:NADH dehydrogenase FAD-containing subunit